MRLLILSFLFAISRTPTFAQDLPSDSIKMKLELLDRVGKSQRDDLKRVELLALWADTISQDRAAIRVWTRILNLAEAAKFKNWQLTAQNRLGRHYGRDGQYYRACEYLFSALSLSEELSDTNSQSYALRLLGDYHLELGQAPEAVGYYKRALTMLNKKNNPSLYLLCQNNLGLVYFYQKKYNEAIKQFLYCVEENKEINDKNITNYCIVNLSACYREIGNHGKSLAYMEQFRKSNSFNKNDLAFADSQTARIYFDMGKYTTALKYAKESYKIQKSVKASTLEDINDILYRIYRNKKQYRSSLRHLEEFNNVKLTNELHMKKKQIESLKFSYENEKQKENILFLTDNIKQKKAQQSLLLVSLLIFFLIVISTLYANNVLRKKNIKINQQKEEINTVSEMLYNSNIELSTLNETLEDRVRARTQDLTDANNELIRKNNEIKEAFFNGQSLERKRVASELHDNLGSTLSGLKWQLEALDSNNFSIEERSIYSRILRRMEEAYSEVRLISHNLLPEELETKGLSAAIIRLLKDLNRSDRIVFNFSSDYQEDTLGKKGEMELYSVCLELINNIIKHSKATEASICIKQTEKSILFTISDNGVGFTSDHITSKKDGNGLKNVHSRLSSINGHLDIQTSRPNGTIVFLEIQLSSLI